MISVHTKRTALISLILVSFVASFGAGCAKKKKPSAAAEAIWKLDRDGIPDSSGLAWVSRYCEKIRDCAQDDLKSLNADAAAILEKRLRKDFCLERFKETKVYAYPSQDPRITLERTISCFKTATEAQCSEIKKGVANLSEDCKWLDQLQNSNG
ncbi:hypothetical protein EHO59_04055 [Leptospira semungkisensis]|uniref:Lipoprotein n=1 Tax=Leptospira semungkisensis TaxID=2484985 RepID=A0A4R9G8C1_9LEPT|nr:hypothetical protein [Leptospira semungkisensis]TGK07290.1 hypothetical protein EHO59_04055 [Leptospira semungkisensis]